MDLVPSVLLTARILTFGYDANLHWVNKSVNQSRIVDRRLLPVAENSAIVMNCAKGFQRENKSWLLDWLLSDHEIHNPVDEDQVAIQTDFFELGPLQYPQPDLVWWLGWLTIVAEIGPAILPWVLYGDWAIVMIVLAGTSLAFISCCLPQWRDEKWTGRILVKENVICLTRGNGHKHIMILLGRQGSPDLETFSAAQGSSRVGTPIVSGLLAIL